MNKIIILLLLILFTQSCGTGTTRKPLPRIPENTKKLALVIGNWEYVYENPLVNPENDAKLIADTLIKNGFELISHRAQINLRKEQMDQFLDEFGKKLSNDTIALFYYSGHGSEIDGHNYLIPVDVNTALSKDELKKNSLDVDSLLQKMRNANTSLNIMILDACRSGQNSREGGSRLSGFVTMDAPKGMLIAYSTAPKKTALDYIVDAGGQQSENSPYTMELVNSINKHGYSLWETFNETGLHVMEITDPVRNPRLRHWITKPQTPWVSNSPIAGGFCFSGCDDESIWWSRIEDTKNPVVVDEYLSTYPKGKHAAEASSKLDDFSKRFYIYSDIGEISHGSWSNFMPANAAKNDSISISTAHQKGYNNLGTSVAINFKLTNPPFWAGLAVASEEGYWGERSGPGFDISGAKELVFHAKGQRGGEQIQVKAAITHIQNFGDTAQRPIIGDWITLTNDWKEYRIPIAADIDLKRVITPFVVVSNRDKNSSEAIRFYVDEIYYER